MYVLPSVSHGIINLHGGSVGVMSGGEGEGSTFFCEVPVYVQYDRSVNSTDSCVLPSSCPGSDAEVSRQSDNTSSLATNGDDAGIGIASPSAGCENCGGDREGPASSVNDGTSRSLQGSHALCSDSISPDENILQGKRVLIVDDAAMVRKLLNKTLSAKDALCTEAEDGIEALQKIFTASDGTPIPSHSLHGSESDIEESIRKGHPTMKHFDVILLDNVMPNLGGIVCACIASWRLVSNFKMV